MNIERKVRFLLYMYSENKRYMAMALTKAMFSDFIVHGGSFCCGGNSVFDYRGRIDIVVGIGMKMCRERLYCQPG